MGVGKLLALAGVLLLVLGLLLWLGESWGGVRLGRLPGDFQIRRGNFTFYLPLATCLLLSLLFSLIFYLFRK